MSSLVEVADSVRRGEVSALELADDLRRFLAHEPIRARPATTSYLVARFARRHALLLAGVAAGQPTRPITPVPPPKSFDIQDWTPRPALVSRTFVHWLRLPALVRSTFSTRLTRGLTAAVATVDIVSEEQR